MHKNTLVPCALRRRLSRDVALEPLHDFSLQDRIEFLEGIPAQDRAGAEEHLDGLLELDDRRRWDYIQVAIGSITRMIQESGRFEKPVMTLAEAAEMVSLSTKRIENIISEERSRLGRSPSWVCDAGGKITRRIIRDEFLDWIKLGKRRIGRPRKGSF